MSVEGGEDGGIVGTGSEGSWVRGGGGGGGGRGGAARDVQVGVL